MDRSITENILLVCNVLKKHGVEYLIVGGTAVAMHGYFRWSSNQNGELSEKYDLDIWYNPTYNNYFKLLDVLEELGQDVAEFRSEQSPNPKSSFFNLDMERFTLDFFIRIKRAIEISISV